jgi:hypothetical protein
VAELARLQREFLARVTGGDVPDGLIASGDLDIYTRMYASRLHDALADDYPKLRTALGDERFAEVAEDYLRAHPPRSFTLREAGVALAEHLRSSMLAPAWAADLAALERARLEVFDGPDAAPLAQADVIALDTRLPELVLAWVAASSVVPLAWAVDDLWSALEDDQPVFAPAHEARVVLVWRRELAVLHRTLDPDEAELAQQIAIGVAFAEICTVLGGLHGEAAGERGVELLLRWLAAEAVVAQPTAPITDLDR